MSGPGRIRRWVAPIVFALLFLGAWQLYVVVADVPESSLPSPTEIAVGGLGEPAAC